MERPDQPRTWEEITPARATEMLELTRRIEERDHVKILRIVRSSKVALYRRDMSQGKWNEQNPQGLVLGPDGEVLGGQHRLLALIAARVTLHFWVTRNVPRSVQPCIDDVTKWSPADCGTFSNADIATARAIENRGPSISTSNVEALRITEKHEKAIRFVSEYLRPYRKGVTISPVRGAIARAWYARPDLESHLRLQEFCAVLASGRPNGPHDGAAISLRECLLGGRRKSKSSWETNKNQYLETETCLQAFLEKRDLTRKQVRAAKKELFLLPGEIE